MTTTTAGPGFVEVAGSLEPKAIAGDIARDAHARVAEAVTLTLDWLEEDGNPLNQKQKIQFVESVLRSMDGFEHATLDTLVDAFSRIERSDDA